MRTATSSWGEKGAGTKHPRSTNLQSLHQRAPPRYAAAGADCRHPGAPKERFAQHQRLPQLERPRVHVCAVVQASGQAIEEAAEEARVGAAGKAQVQLKRGNAPPRTAIALCVAALRIAALS